MYWSYRVYFRTPSSKLQGCASTNPMGDNPIIKGDNEVEIPLAFASCDNRHSSRSAANAEYDWLLYPGDEEVSTLTTNTLKNSTKTIKYHGPLTTVNWNSSAGIWLGAGTPDYIKHMMNTCTTIVHYKPWFLELNCFKQLDHASSN